MPIITDVSAFDGYPFRALDPALAKMFLSAGKKLGTKLSRTTSLLIRLECFLQVSRLTFRYAELGKDSGAQTLARFAAALYSQTFHSSSQPWSALLHFRNLQVSLLGSTTGFPPFPCTFNRTTWTKEFREQVDGFRLDDLDQERLEFWRGWNLRNLEGREFSLRLWPVWERHGRQMASELHRATQDWFGGRRFEAVPCFNEFLQFLATREDPLDTSDPVALGNFFRDFFEEYFRKKYALGVQLQTLTTNWMHFAALLDKHLFIRYWAAPIPRLPTPPRIVSPGSITHLRTTDEGVEVRHALVTTVPLSVTDVEAKEILFKAIRRDVDLLVRWARAEVAKARERLNNRKQLAASGVVNRTGRTGENTGLRFRASRACPDHLAHAAATFEHAGYSYLDDQSARAIFPTPLELTTWDLGLPTPELLLAHATILVAAHPQITCSFLENLKLFDKDGQRVGLVETDGGWYLVGDKRRKASAKAQQKVLLTTETLQVVRDVIELTNPLREYLKSKHDDRCRRLFLCTRSLGKKPNRWDPAHEAFRCGEWLAQHLVEHAGLDTAAATDLAKRFSLKRLRSSAGVLIYLETGSVAAMAKALGHDKYRPKLLDHYLPESIQEFFIERWIRLFQTGMLCEALKDSPYLQRVFDSMEELDTFLENHALRRLPAHLEDPELEGAQNASPETRRVVFGISVEVLSLLKSVERAVALSKAEPCGRAIRWAKISERLFDHLASQADQPEFRTLAAEAIEKADVSKVEDLICG